MTIRSCIVLLSLIFIISCAGDEDPMMDECGAPVDVEITDNFGSVRIVLPSAFYDRITVEYGPTGFTKGQGMTVENSCCFAEIIDLEYLSTYDFYIQGVCVENLTRSAWTSVFTKTLERSPCAKPIVLFEESDGGAYHALKWQKELEAPIQPDLYELEYGERNFTLGEGARFTLNDTYFLEGIFFKGVTYDFYARSICNGIEDSPWVGPSTFIAEVSQNICEIPWNIQNFDPIGPDAVKFIWDTTGDSMWEVAYNNYGTTPSPSPPGLVTTTIPEISFPDLNGNYTNNYYFYFRTVCPDGSKTDWSDSVEVFL